MFDFRSKLVISVIKWKLHGKNLLVHSETRTGVLLAICPSKHWVSWPIEATTLSVYSVPGVRLAIDISDEAGPDDLYVASGSGDTDTTSNRSQKPSSTAIASLLITIDVSSDPVPSNFTDVIEGPVNSKNLHFGTQLLGAY